MSNYEDDWQIQDGEEEVELEDRNYGPQRDAILFCIDIGAGMLEVQESSSDNETGRCALETILRAALDLQKRKILHGPSDAVGILFYNTAETKGESVKRNMYLYQAVSQINAPDIQNLIQLLNEADDDPTCFSKLFKPSEKRVSMTNLFQTCSHALREGVSKLAIKRIFLFTDDDDPESGNELKQKATQRIVQDIRDLGITIKPFFLTFSGLPFDVRKFYRPVLAIDDNIDDVTLNVHESLEGVVADMRLHEGHKRAMFNVPMELGNGLSIGVKGYGLVVEKKKGTYQYYANMGRTIEEATPVTKYLYEDEEEEVPKSSVVFGYLFGSGAAEVPDDEDGMDEDKPHLQVKDKVFFTPAEIMSFRTLDLKPSIKILGFKHRDSLPFDANIKHSVFLHPNEAAVTGSVRTFKALLDSMLAKKKYALTRCMFRRNNAMVFCAMLPQAEITSEGLQVHPAGFHLVPLPYADDIRELTVEQSASSSQHLEDAAVAIIERLTFSAGYNPESIPNPSLALHYGYLQAEAFGEEFDPENDFSDRSAPRYRAIHKKTGAYVKAWKEILDEEPEAAEAAPEPKAGAKRKAGAVDELVVRSHFDDDTLNKLTVEQLKTYLKSHNQPYSGRKSELMERVQDWCTDHPA